MKLRTQQIGLAAEEINELEGRSIENNQSEAEGGGRGGRRMENRVRDI